VIDGSVNRIIQPLLSGMQSYFTPSDMQERAFLQTAKKPKFGYLQPLS